MSTFPFLLTLFALFLPSLADISTSTPIIPSTASLPSLPGITTSTPITSGPAFLPDISPWTPITPGTACDSTPDPAFCKSILPPTGKQNLHSYTKFSLTKSLSNANKFLTIIDRYHTRPPSSSVTTVRALDDCSLLASLNIDFLNSAGSTINSTTTLLDPQTETIQTLLSALLTNHQTCLDEVQTASSSWSPNSSFTEPLTDGSKLFSVSLSLFNRAWGVPKVKNPRNSFTPSNTPNFHNMNINKKGADLQLRMSQQNRKLLEQRNGRKLFQTPNTVKVTDIVVVSQDGTGNFTAIGDAVAAAPNKTDGSNGYFLIYVTAGVYQEYVTIPKYKKYVMMVGDGIDQTVITGNRNNVDGWTTFASATFAVIGEGFVGINMTIQNTAGAAKHQAVALLNNADLSSFYLCSFEGYQDTLYVHALRQFYRECNIYGTVDYIFGNAAVVFQKCNIYSRLPLSGQENTVTAQGRTDPNQNTGISIQSSVLLAAPDLVADNGTTGTLTYLGRPWKNYSRMVIMQSSMDSLINPAGWLPWDGDFALSTLYYAEYSNTGLGANTSNRVTWAGYHDNITSTDAANFTVTSFIFGDNWLPMAGVPYSSALI